MKAERAARRRPPPYYYEARARYFAKFYGRAGLVATNLLWAAGRGVSAFRESVGDKRAHTCEGEERDIWLRWRDPLRQLREGESMLPGSAERSGMRSLAAGDGKR